MTRKERFQKNFETALKCVEEAEKQARSKDIDNGIRVLEKLAVLDATGRENDLSCAVVDDKPMVGLVAVKRPPAGFATKAERRLVNGIDVSNMVIDGTSFDLEKVKGRDGFDGTGLTQKSVKVQRR